MARSFVGAATVAAAAVLLSLAGIYWDVTWHAVVGRDSFWIPPHLLVYAGVTAAGLAALAGGAWRVRDVGSVGAALRDPVAWALAVAGAGPALQIAAAPLDDLWHLRYGLDVTVWSPPHLMGIAGGMVGIYGWLAVLRATGALRSRPGRALATALLAGALALSMFALGELDFHLDQRDTLLYPLLAGLFAAVPLAAAPAILGGRWSALAVAGAYTAFRVLVLGIVWLMGAHDHLSPPVAAIAPALVVDVAARAGSRLRLVLAAALAGPAFLAGEWLSRVAFGGPAWAPLEVAASTAFVAAVVAVGVLAGDRLGSTLAGSDPR